MRRWWYVPIIALLLVLFFRARPAGYTSTPTDSTATPPVIGSAVAIASMQPTPSIVPTEPATAPPDVETAYPAPSVVAELPSPTSTVLPTPTIVLPTPTHEPPALAAEVAPPTPQPEPTSVNQRKAFELVPIRIQIPAIDLDLEPVSVGLDEKRVPIVPKHDAGWFNTSALPGTGSNTVLWGHVLRWLDSPNIAAPFARLHELRPGASIEVTLSDGQQFTYRVTEQVQAKPEQVEYILPTSKERLTLVSCIGDKVIREGVLTKEFRLITIAERQ